VRHPPQKKLFYPPLQIIFVVLLVDEIQILDLFEIYKEEMTCQVVVGVFDSSTCVEHEFDELEPICVVPLDDVAKLGTHDACWVLRFFTTQAKCIHEGRIKRGGRVSPSYMHVSSTGWVGGIYTPNLYYIMTSMPLPAQNILRIFRAVGHFTGWNVQIVYSVRFVLGTLSRRFSATFGLVPDLRQPS